MGKNKIYLKILGILLIITMIYCSGPIQDKVEKKTPKAQKMNNKKKVNDKTLIKASCTDCHKSNESGDLIFRDKNSKIDIKKKN